jgi:hypothetical protein
MTETGKDQSEDRGFVFNVVRMQMPPPAAIEKLAPDMQALVQANIERARRIFRSRTLPLLGSDARLFPEPFWIVSSLSRELDDVILEGIRDEDARAILAPPQPKWKRDLPTRDEDPGLRVEIVWMGRGEEIDDQVKVARVMQKRLDSALGFPEKPWHDWDEWDLNDCYFLTGRAKPMLGHSQPQ